MARTRAPGRLTALLDAGMAAFVRAGGFHRAQVEDVARLMGVAKGTVYLYVENKETLLHLLLGYAGRPEALPHDAPLPFPAASLDDTARMLAERLRSEGGLPALEKAAHAKRRPSDVSEELLGILGEIYDLLHRHRHAIKLLSVVAPDVPQLGSIWWEGGRGRLNALLSTYLAARARTGALATWPNPTAAARITIESITWAAVHRHFDPHPQRLEDAQVRETTLHMLHRALLPGGGA